MTYGRTMLLACALAAAPHGTAAAQTIGALSGAEPVASAPPAMQAWRVRYWTSTGRGAPIEVTGMIVAPLNQGPARERPVLAWAHGTWGVVPKCVPTLAQFFDSTPGLSDAIQRGYVVVAPDYPGLGSPGPHPYLVGPDTARSVLDAVRAARHLPAARAGGSFAVWGESQGGHAALWTGQIARSYAPELRLLGVAAAAPPTDLIENLRSGSNASVRAFLTAFTTYSWSQHFNVSLSSLGGSSTQKRIARLARNNCITPGAKLRIGTMIGVLALRSNLRNVDLGRIEPWAGLAAENSPAARAFGVPVLIAQNPQDGLVSAAVTRAFAERMCRSGAPLRYVPISGSGHQTSGKDSAVATLDWIDERFRGRPAPSDCGRF